MTSTIDKIRIKNDKRKKLSDEEKALLIRFKDMGKGRNETARYFGVSTRTVDFLWYPEKLEHSKKLRRERLMFDPQRYYDKEKHTKSIADIRARKKSENIEKFTKKCEMCGKEFICDTMNQVYCSEKCRWRMGNKKAWVKHKMAIDKKG